MRAHLVLWVLLSCVLFGCVNAQGTAQTLELDNPGPGTVTLNGPWLFHTGDDLSWAAVDLPPSSMTGWESIDPARTWGTQGHESYTGFAWYRLRLDVASGKASAILIPPVDDLYELFWNGNKIGTYGEMPPHARLLNAPHATVYSLPLDRSGRLQGVLALRVWKSQLASNDPSTLGGLNDVPVLGERSILDRISVGGETSHNRIFFVRTIISSIVVVAGLITFLIYTRGNRKPIYLWLSIYLITDSSTALLNIFRWYQATLFESQCLNGGRSVICNLALWFILLHLFGMAGEVRWRRITLILFSIDLALELVDCTVLYFWQYSGTALPRLDALTTAGYTLIPVYLFVLLGVGLKRRSRSDLWPLAISLSAYGLYQVTVDASTQGVRFTGLMLSQMDQWTFSVGEYPVGIRVLLDLLFLGTLFFTVERRQQVEREQHNALEQEIKSAREIQRLLVPARLPQVPGFAIDAIYHPAQEVGGDFFQILPTARGMVVIVGDVSGKGLKAAMTVSLIVGALRTLVEISDSPAMLLAGLNRRLSGGASEGFSTCVALRFDPGGQVTLSNAGHLSPFLNATELPVEGSLPLGLVDGVAYDESTFFLAESDRLTLFTDGLLEAQNSKGELYGFDRVAGLMARLPSVREMLNVATTFGQEDDITILTLTRSADSTTGMGI